jgi:hypothetical protein
MNSDVVCADTSASLQSRWLLLCGPGDSLHQHSPRHAHQPLAFTDLLLTCNILETFGMNQMRVEQGMVEWPPVQTTLMAGLLYRHYLQKARVQWCSPGQHQNHTTAYYVWNGTWLVKGARSVGLRLRCQSAAGGACSSGPATASDRLALFCPLRPKPQ